MQTQSFSKFILGAALAGGLSVSAAAQPVYITENIDGGPWYFRGGAGPDWMQNSRLSLDSTMPDARVKFDTGARVDLAGGYMFNPYFGLEGQTGFIYNRVSEIEASPYTRADFVQVPLMVNAVFQLPNDSRLTPFIGGGAGATVDNLNIDDATVQGAYLHGSDSVGVFAYQAFGGVRFALQPRIDLSLAYEFLGSKSPEWDVRGGDFAGMPGTLKLHNPETHAVMMAVVVRF